MCLARYNLILTLIFCFCPNRSFFISDSIISYPGPMTIENLSAFLCPKINPSPSNGEHEHARDSTASMAALFSNKTFRKEYANA